MPESSLLAGVYENLTKPIREKPFASLAFFFCCLGCGALLSHWLPAQVTLWEQALVTLLFVFPSAGVLLSLHRLVVTRDQPSGLIDPAVLEGIKKSFVGRDEDAEVFMGVILSSYQVWLNGDSGVGKSLLLQRSILPALREKNIAVVYLNEWRGDWEEAPAVAILTAMNKIPGGTVMGSLSTTLDEAAGLVVVLDQFDEFQINYRDKLITAHGQVISRSQLEQSNQFFRILNSAVRDGRVRCIFVTRRDVEWGKRVVLFENADEFFLRRLAKNIVESEIHRIVRDDVISNTENGWNELREQLCDDLGNDGVLPIQMRFAVLGLEELRHSLTLPAYFRIGRIRGLIAAYLEREIRRVAGNRLVAAEIFRLLNLLVTPDGKSTEAVDENELKLISSEFGHDIPPAFDELERRDIVRRVLSKDGKVLWRLDHDYLAGPVREIARRQLPEQWELKERYQRFAASNLFQRTLRLAGPVTIVKLAWARCFHGLRFGAAASWFLFSISGVLAVCAGLTYSGSYVADWLQSQKLGPRLFSVFRSSPHSGTSISEARALLELSQADMPVRRSFLETALESGENAQRLTSHEYGIGLALSHARLDESHQLFDALVRPVLTRKDQEPQALAAALSIMRRWEAIDFLNGFEADQLASKLVEQMENQATTDSLSLLTHTLNSLKDKIEPQTADQLALKAVERKEAYAYGGSLGSNLESLDLAKDQLARAVKLWELASAPRTITFDSDGRLMSVFGSRGDGRTWVLNGHSHFSSEVSDYSPPDIQTLELKFLEAKMTPATADLVASKLVARMERETNAQALSRLSSRLGSLKDKIGQSTAEQLVAILVERMDHVDAKGQHQLAAAMGFLKDKVAVVRVEEAAVKLVERMRTETDHSALQEIAAGLRLLKDRVGTATAERLGAKLAERIKQISYASDLHQLALTLGSFKDQIGSLGVEGAASKLVARMGRETDSDTLEELVSGFSSLKDRIGSVTAERLASSLVDRMGQITDTQAMFQLATGLAYLKNRVLQSQIDGAASKLVARMSKETDSSALKELVNGLRLLKDRVGMVTSERLASSLVERMGQVTDAQAMCHLAAGVGLLKDKVSPQAIGAAASRLVEQMDKESDPSAFIMLANGLGSLTDQSAASTIQTAGSRLVGKMGQLTDASTLSDLAASLAVLADQVGTTTIDQAASRLVERMDKETDAGLLRKLATGLSVLEKRAEPQTIQHGVVRMVEQIGQQTDPDELRKLVSGLTTFNGISLSAKEIAQVSVVFHLPEAPCRIVLQFEPNSLRTEEVRQLANPLCAETDWKLLALDAAQRTKRPIASGDKLKPDEIVVNFSELEGYLLVEHDSGTRQILPLPVLASLLLLLGAAAALILALVRSRHRLSVAG